MGCARRTDCGKCQHCLDLAARGGGGAACIPFGHRYASSGCAERACRNPLRFGAAAEWRRQKPALKRAVELLLSKAVRAALYLAYISLIYRLYLAYISPTSPL